MISPTQRTLHDNTQHSQETEFHIPDGIQTRNPRRRAAVDTILRPHSHWDRPQKHSPMLVVWKTKQKRKGKWKRILMVSCSYQRTDLIILYKNPTNALFMLTSHYSHCYAPKCFSPEASIWCILWAGSTKCMSRCKYLEVKMYLHASYTEYIIYNIIQRVYM
jgi:hypothetical protein